MNDKLKQNINDLKLITADVADYLLEIINSSVCDAASDIGTASGKITSLEIEEIKEYTSLKEFLEEEKVVTAEIPLSEIDDSFVFAFKEDDAISLSNVESKPKAKEISEEQLKGFGDLINKFGTAISKDLSNSLKLEIKSKEPVLNSELTNFENEILVIYFTLKEDDEARNICQILSVPLINKLNKEGKESVSVEQSGILDDVVSNVQSEQQHSNNPQDAVTVQPVKFASFESLTPALSENSKNLDLLMDIKLKLTVELGRTELPIKKVLELTRGSVIELNKVAGEPVELLANGKLIAIGEVVVIEDNFGLRLTSIVSPEHHTKAI